MSGAFIFETSANIPSHGARQSSMSTLRFETQTVPLNVQIV